MGRCEVVLGGITIVKKRIILFGICIIIIILSIFLKSNWSLIKLKYGIDSYIIWSGDIYKRMEVNSDIDKKFLIEVKNKNIEELNIKLTDIVYLPNLNRISYGLIYNKKDYEKSNIPISNFRIKVVDEKGNENDSGGFARTSGTFEVFQQRYISNVDISNIEQLTMYIYPLEIIETQTGEVEVIEKTPVKKLIYSKDMEPLKEIKDKQ